MPRIPVNMHNVDSDRFLGHPLGQPLAQKIWRVRISEHAGASDRFTNRVSQFAPVRIFCMGAFGFASLTNEERGIYLYCYLVIQSSVGEKENVSWMTNM